jgi:hypothetical protein
MITVRIFDGHGNVKDVKMNIKEKSVTVHYIKQLLQTKFNVLSSHTMITSQGHDTLYNDDDTIILENVNILLAFVKDRTNPLGFRVASAKARKQKYEKVFLAATH